MRKEPIRHKDQYIEINTGKVFTKKELEREGHAYKIVREIWRTIEGKTKNHIYKIIDIIIYGVQQRLF